MPWVGVLFWRSKIAANPVRSASTVSTAVNGFGCEEWIKYKRYRWWCCLSFAGRLVALRGESVVVLGNQETCQSRLCLREGGKCGVLYACFLSQLARAIVVL